MPPPEPPLPTAILYSAAAMRAVEDIRQQVGRRIKVLAVAAANREGRTTITDDDIWAASDNLGLEDIYE